MSKVDILKQHQLLEATGHTRPSMAAALTHSVDWNQSVSFQVIESVNKSDCLVVGRRSLGISVSWSQRLAGFEAGSVCATHLPVLCLVSGHCFVVPDSHVNCLESGHFLQFQVGAPVTP